MPCGPSSRAMLCASARSACLEPAKAAKPAAPRWLAVAPVNRMVPRPRGSITRAALAPHQEAGQRAHLPHLAVHALGGLGDAEAHVGADVEHHHVDRRDLLLDVLEQRGHLLLVARVRAEGVHHAAVGADLLHQRLQVFHEAAGDARHQPLARKAPGDGAAGGVARAPRSARPVRTAASVFWSRRRQRPSCPPWPCAASSVKHTPRHACGSPNQLPITPPSTPAYDDGGRARPAGGPEVGPVREAPRLCRVVAFARRLAGVLHVDEQRAAVGGEGHAGQLAAHRGRS